MAHVDMLHTNFGTLLFYNVTWPVGPGCVNKREDVLLVQYLLREAFKTPLMNSPNQLIRITGRADEIALAEIKNFQLELRKQKSSLSAADGRIDPARHVRSSTTNTIYTIIDLNLAYEFMRPNDYPKMAEASDCPAELRVVLKPTFIRNR